MCLLRLVLWRMHACGLVYACVRCLLLSFLILIVCLSVHLNLFLLGLFQPSSKQRNWFSIPRAAPSTSPNGSSSCVVQIRDATALPDWLPFAFPHDKKGAS